MMLFTKFKYKTTKNYYYFHNPFGKVLRIASNGIFKKILNNPFIVKTDYYLKRGLQKKCFIEVYIIFLLFYFNLMLKKL